MTAEPTCDSATALPAGSRPRPVAVLDLSTLDLTLHVRPVHTKEQ